MAYETASVRAYSFLRHQGRAPVQRAAMIGNFPPRICGIATFTRDLLTGLKTVSPATDWTVVAMNDRPAEPYDFAGAVDHIIEHDNCDAYISVADALNKAGVEVTFVQHEFGIFGGAAGSHLLLLLRRLRMPVVVTLHTVLERPDVDQRRVIEEIVGNAAAVVTMTRKGADMLQSVYGAPAEKIHVIPHGAPFSAIANGASLKEALGLASRRVVTTFGLLSPNKGLETIIDALPGILERHPTTTYLVVGATHPNLVAKEGERYRDSLLKLAEQRDVAKNVRFINRFVSDEELVNILLATDVYATPYLSESQITSGTLSYAIALGRPIVSTPYWHAAEALDGGVGILCPFGDAACFSRAITSILSDDRLRQQLASRARDAGKPSRWSNVARSYLRIAADLCEPANPTPTLF